MLTVWGFFFFFFNNENCGVPSHLHNYPLCAKAVTKVVGPTSTPSHCSRSLGYDHCILPFVDVEAKECIEHVSDKEEEEEEGMKDNRGSYKVSMHGSTLTALNVLIALRTLICVSNFFLYFHLCPKSLVSILSAMPPQIHFSNLHEFFFSFFGTNQKFNCKRVTKMGEPSQPKWRSRNLHEF